MFAPFDGFRAHPLYEGYSANFFDGQHFVQKGASPRTAACMLRRSFRNWFQPHYRYVYAGFRLTHEQAVAASGRLPDQYRAAFVDGFSNAAHAGFEVGAGQSGASLQLPAQVEAVAHYVFIHAFVDAMHPTMLLPIAILVIAAFASFLVRAPRQAVVAVHEQEAAVA